MWIVIIIIDDITPRTPSTIPDISTNSLIILIAFTNLWLFVIAKPDMYEIAEMTRLNDEINPLLTAFCPINSPPTVTITFWSVAFGDLVEESLNISKTKIKNINSK